MIDDNNACIISLNNMIEYIIQSGIWTKITIAFLVFFIIDVLFIFISSKIAKTFNKTKNSFDDIVLYSIKSPFRLGLWFSFLILSINLIDNFLVLKLNFLSKIYLIGISVILLWLILRFINAVEKEFITNKFKDKKDSVVISAKVLKIFIIFVVLIVIAQSLGYSVTAILTFGGLGGMVVAFSAKDMLANIFGGFMLHIDKPFSIGDWIRISSKNIEGTVEDIGWRVTRIRTFSNNPVYVPNSIFSTVSIETPSRMINRRINETIGIRYEDINNIENILKDIKTMLEKHDDIDNKHIIMVNLKKFSEYSVDFFIYAFAKTKVWAEYNQIKEDVLLKINKIITKHNAEIAYPTAIRYHKN